jgi:phospholipase/carboxylesterase
MHDNHTAPVIIAAPGRHTATVIWLHGLGADGHDFEPIVPELGLPAGHGIKFIFPHAPHRPVTVNGGFVMRAWYDIRRANLSEVEDAAGITASAQSVEHLMDSEIAGGITPNRLVLAGFSQGGAIALYCGVRSRQPVALVLALSTYLPLQTTTQTEHTPASLTTPVLMCHGTADPIVPLAAGRQSADRLRVLGYAVDWREYPMGHSLCDEEIDDIGACLRRHLG